MIRLFHFCVIVLLRFRRCVDLVKNPAVGEMSSLRFAPAAETLVYREQLNLWKACQILRVGGFGFGRSVVIFRDDFLSFG